jgi:hypothetical protein
MRGLDLCRGSKLLGLRGKETNGNGDRKIGSSDKSFVVVVIADQEPVKYIFFADGESSVSVCDSSAPELSDGL